MSGLLLIAAAYAAQQRRNSHRRAARLRQASRNSSQESNSYSSSRKGVPYLDCVDIEMQDDPKMMEFFENLMWNAQTIRREKGKSIEDEAKKFDETIVKFEEERAKLVTQMQEAGIETQVTDSYSYSLAVFEVDKKSEEKSKPKEIPIIGRFNGLYLKEAMLSNPNYTGLRDNYEKLKAECDEHREKQPQLEKKIKRTEFWLRVLPFGKDNLNQRLKDLKYELRNYADAYNREEEAKNKSEIFDALTPEQKELILKYIKATDCIRTAGYEIYSKGREFHYNIPKIDDKEVIEKALERTVQQGSITEEDIMDIFTKLDRVAIRRFRGEYDSRVRFSSCSLSDREKTIRGFIKHIYDEDPTMTERNMELVLEDEKTRED